MKRFFLPHLLFVLSFSLFILFPAYSIAHTEGGVPVPIMDNSFIVEEAYNQEAGVIQNINTFQLMDNSEWGYTFTQEWPVPDQRNQLSYTITVYNVNSTVNGTGLGDTLLNYRYQAIFNSKLAMAPRFSVILPSGDASKDLGTDSVGMQINLPVSVRLSPRWTTTLNAGFTFTPKAKGIGSGRANTYDILAGAGLSCFVTSNFSPIVEFLWISGETVAPTGGKSRDNYFYIDPGVRFAINFKSGLQIVPGIAAMIGMVPGQDRYGMMSYLSFEFPMWKPRKK